LSYGRTRTCNSERVH